MQIELRSRVAIPQEEHAAYAERRLRFALSRFADRLRFVRVTVDDVNGPRGGVDKHVRIRLVLWDASSLLLSSEDHSVFAAIDDAAERAARTLARELARRRDFQRESARYPVH